MAPSAKILSFAQKSPRGSRARKSQSCTKALKNQGKSGKNLYRRNGAGLIPVTSSKRTSLWIQRFPARPGTIQGGVFAVLWWFLGVEAGCVVPWRSLTAADRSLGGVTQGLARCVEAESVKKCGLASKSSAPRQTSTASRSHRSTRKRQGPKEGPETEFEKPGHVGFGPSMC